MEDRQQTIDRDTLDLKVWVRLLSCATQIKKRLQRKFSEQFGITLPRFDVMASLDRCPDGQTMSALSQSLLVSNGNVTAIVRELEKQGLVVSRTDSADRRASIVALSPAGKTRFAELAAAHKQWVETAMADFSPDKQEQLLALLADLKLSLGKN